MTVELVYSVFSVLYSLIVSERYSQTLTFCSLAEAEYELGDLTFLFSNILKSNQ